VGHARIPLGRPRLRARHHPAGREQGIPARASGLRGPSARLGSHRRAPRASRSSHYSPSVTTICPPSAHHPSNTTPAIISPIISPPPHPRPTIISPSPPCHVPAISGAPRARRRAAAAAATRRARCGSSEAAGKASSSRRDVDTAALARGAARRDRHLAHPAARRLRQSDGVALAKARRREHASQGVIGRPEGPPSRLGARDTVLPSSKECYRSRSPPTSRGRGVSRRGSRARWLNWALGLQLGSERAIGSDGRSI
jgi:pyruvate/2-oxoglutarate dehydrogenase complex dihydrolipoamide acyltransferase (E2) component